ncbi:MAG: ATP-dependent DNA helicase RecQ [Gammaproteobacteria bacterium]|jgi:ATP-dependent DNA helicase RecQ
MKTMSDLRRELQQRFGFNDFRDGQEAAITRLMAKRSVLAIFPTGAGKSLCYQLPALLLDGLTVVISPLIALMKDQLDFLAKMGAPAARLDSSLTKEENRQLFDDLHASSIKLLYISPERLGNERFLRALRRHRISLLAIDEAHCISEWGHNFRPDYLKIAQLAKDLNVERTLALTATATPAVAIDVRAAFAIAADDQVHTGFYRPNLQLGIVPCAVENRSETLLAKLRGRPPGSTVVYVTLQRTAEHVATYLSSNGVRASAYHAGLKSDERSAIQNSFMQSDDTVIVATIAFGMGIDKSNIRYVYHYNLPKGLESYSQEIGRAGRDGEPAVCEMLASAHDVITLENFSYGDTPEVQTVDDFTRHLFAAGETFDISEYELSARFDLRPLVVKTLLTYLELEGCLASTGSFYSEYKFQAHRTSAEILASVEAQHATFLRAVFQHAVKGRVWLTLDTALVSRQINEPRERIVSALIDLEEQGDLTLQVSGLRQGYRRLREPSDMDAFVSALNERFQKRESNDIERIERVLDFAQHDGCLTQYLLAYFGEPREVCGHCCRCHGVESVDLGATSAATFGTSDEKRIRELIAAGHSSIASPRQLTRFLCGISSPATTRAKLRQANNLFGAHATAPFKATLEFVERCKS